MLWILFALGAALSWGLYGPALHRGQTELGNPPERNAKIIQTAPMAPSAPATVAPMEPFMVNPVS